MQIPCLGLLGLYLWRYCKDSMKDSGKDLQFQRVLRLKEFILEIPKRKEVSNINKQSSKSLLVYDGEETVIKDTTDNRLKDDL